jgi:DNA-binding transcriptional LysR family regulator
MLDDVRELRVFVRIAQTGSLSAAARDLGIGLSLVSKRLASLERRSQTRLMARSTRRLALTDEGRRLFDRAQRIIAEIDEAEAALTFGRAEAEGVLRVSAPIGLGRLHVSPVCRALIAAHPRISVDLSLTDRFVGIIDEAMDVVVRVGQPQDSGLIMRKIADNHRILIASPDYVADHGMPQVPADLGKHECLTYGSLGTKWHLFTANGEEVEVTTTSRLRSDSGDVSHDWSLAGAGIAQKSWVDSCTSCRNGGVSLRRFMHSSRATDCCRRASGCSSTP